MRVVHRIAYDTDRYPFAEVAAEVLGVRSLETLAEEALQAKQSVDPAAQLESEDNFRLRALLTATAPDHPLRNMYFEVAREAITELMDGKVALTSNPTFRVQLPGTKSVSAWHRDADITRRLDYVNLWIPFVDVEGDATIWIEDDYGSERYEPVPVAYGEILLFDGGLLRHGSVSNTTTITRVSLDARFAPKTDEGRTAIAHIVAGRREEDLVLTP